MKIRKRKRMHVVVGIETLDSDLMNFRKTPIGRRTQIGLESVATKGEKREESLKGV